MLIVPNLGEQEILDWAFRSAGENQILRLYSSGTLSESVEASDLVEVDAAGYSTKTLTRASWDAPSTTDNITSIAYASQTFNLSAAATVAGYYITGAISGTLLWAESFSTPLTILSGGGDITITPQIQLD